MATRTKAKESAMLGTLKLASVSTKSRAKCGPQQTTIMNRTRAVKKEVMSDFFLIDTFNTACHQALIYSPRKYGHVVKPNLWSVGENFLQYSSRGMGYIGRVFFDYGSYFRLVGL